MYNCIIVDDENRSVKTLESMIHNYLDEELEILGTANSADEGLALIHKARPNIVFLDIEMPHKSGFDLLEMLETIDFQVIFTTGFDQYAITAFRFNAIDYLLKPINIAELNTAVKKAIFRIETNDSSEELENLLKIIKHPENQDNKIPIPVMGGLQMVKVADISHCEAAEDYTHLHLIDDTSILVSKSIKHLETLLSEYDFFRTHHSFLMNKMHVQKFVKGDNSYILTQNGAKVLVSRRKKGDCLQWLNH